MRGTRVLLSAALLAGMVSIMGMRDAGGVLPVRTVPVGASPILAAVDEQTGRAFVVDWAGTTAPASVSVLDTATGTLLRTVAIGINPRAIAVDRRAGRVFVLNDGAYPAPGHGSISVLDALSGQVLHTVAIGAFPPLQGGVVVDEVRGRAFAINSTAHGGRVTVIASRSGRVARRVRVTGEPTALGVDLSAGHVFVGWVAADETGRVNMLDAASGRVLRAIAVDAYPRTMAADPRSGRMVLITASGVSMLDSRTGAIVHSTALEVAGEATALAVDSRLGRAFTIDRAPRHGFHSAIDIVDTHTGRLLRTVAVGVSAFGEVVDERCGRLFVTNAGSGTVSVIGARAGTLVRTVRVARNPIPLAIDEGAQRVFVATGTVFGSPGNFPPHGTLSVLDACSGSVLRTYPVGTDPSAVAVDTRRGRVFVLNRLSRTVTVLGTAP
jgi:DNA-binding beta-propeller fold protein YncE